MLSSVRRARVTLLAAGLCAATVLVGTPAGAAPSGDGPATHRAASPSRTVPAAPSLDAAASGVAPGSAATGTTVITQPGRPTTASWRAQADRSSHARQQAMPLLPLGGSGAVDASSAAAPGGAAPVSRSAPLTRGLSVPGVNRTPGYRALAPARVLDTRSGLGAPRAAVGPGGRVDVVVLGRGGVPATGVAAVALTVTATGTSASTFVSVYPATSAGAPPVVSNLNVPAGATVANTVVVAPGSGGKARLLNAAGSVNLVADVAGYFEVGGSYHGVTPSRLLDTRTGLGAPAAGVVRPGAQVDLTVTGRGRVPATGVSSVALNVTAVAPTASTAITVFPTGSGRPTASNLNTSAGRTVAVAVLATVGAGGRVSLFNAAGSTHLLADVAGYFTTGGSYVPLTPSRRYDSRTGGGALAPGQYVDFLIAGNNGVSATDAIAVALSVAAVSPAGPGSLSVVPYTPTFVRPNTSSVNFGRGQTTANLVLATIGAAGWVRFYNPSTTTQLVIDVLGYFTDDSTAAQPVGQTVPVAVRDDGRLGYVAATQATASPVSSDGRWVFFAGRQPQLLPYGVENGIGPSLYLRDTVLGRTVLVAAGTLRTATMQPLGLAPDGRTVLFSTDVRYFQNDINGVADVFLYDLVDGSLLQVSWNDAAGSSPVRPTETASMSASGRYVTLTSTAADIGPGFPDDQLAHVYRIDLGVPVATSVVRLIAGFAGAEAVSDTGRVALTGRTTARHGAFVWDAATAYTQVDVSPGTPAGPSNGGNVRINATGRFATFETDAALDPAADVNALVDVYRRDVTAGTTVLVSRDVDGRAVGSAASGTLSADGSKALFSTRSRVLTATVPGLKAYLWAAAGTVTLATPTPAITGLVDETLVPSLSSDGRVVTWANAASDASVTPVVRRLS